ncbi:MAG: ATP-binding protein [Acidimicrobiaceae bacterium]|nr:ATP-binding protein [Acidimicrobiaceae bacterium]
MNYLRRYRGDSARGAGAGVAVADAAGAVLEEDARRRSEEAERDAETVLPDDLLPGVGGEPMTLREGLRAGGPAMAAMMLVLAFVDELPRAVRVLAPDIQRSLGISDTVLFGILGFGGVTLVLGAVPMAALADRVKRVAIIPVASSLWGVAAFLSGLVVNPFQLFLANAGMGFGQAYRIPVSNSLLVDTYPIAARARIFALEGLGRPAGLLLGPLLIGGVAALAGGDDSWRIAFFAVAAAPVAAAAVSAAVLREPPRGRFEREAVFGDVSVELDQVPVSVGAAFARLRKVRTFYYLSTGVGVLGFALFAVPIQFNLLLEDEYAMGPFGRGLVESLISVGALVGLPLAGWLFDRGFRRDPAAIMRMAGMLVTASGVMYAAALTMRSLGALVALMALAQTLIFMAFVAAPSVIAAVSPYRIRAQAFALLPVFIFLMGGFFGGLIVGRLSDAYDERTAMLVAAPPASLVGGALIAYGSRFLRRDISRSVEELLEEREQQQRAVADPATVPALQVRNLDFSYGSVQVLFDVSFEVARGEVVALLGTNGAGKSTLLRAVSGLGVPDRGAVRLGGRTVTYADAEDRFSAGLVQLRGGAGVFEDLSVADNLRASVLASGLDEAEIEARTARALSLFPALAERTAAAGRDLSGGQRQMLALMMVLMHEPEVLLIDELSLGLAPVVVQELLDVVQRLRDDGQTMVIVEQSLNVALSFADRAIFMEKGRVRFEGPARELAERDDLARAVFLGGRDG